MAGFRRAHTHKPKVGGTVPDFARMDAPVKLNVASILREDAVYKKKQEKEKKLIEAYESELRDSTEFYKWQKGMRDQDERERIEAVERRRVEMAASARAARRKKSFRGTPADSQQRNESAALPRLTDTAWDAHCRSVAPHYTIPP